MCSIKATKSLWKAMFVSHVPDFLSRFILCNRSLYVGRPQYDNYHITQAVQSACPKVLAVIIRCLDSLNNTHLFRAVSPLITHPDSVDFCWVEVAIRQQLPWKFAGPFESSSSILPHHRSVLPGFLYRLLRQRTTLQTQCTLARVA